MLGQLTWGVTISKMVTKKVTKRWTHGTVIRDGAASEGQECGSCCFLFGT